jgi:Ca2+/Na+ antiporter
VLLNLCLLLPILGVAPYFRAAVRTVHFSPFVVDVSGFSAHPMVYPLGVWRLDAMVLLIISALFAPVGLGKWNLGRHEGTGLIIMYIVYLVVVTLAAT